MNRRNALGIVAFVVLAIIAIAGWTRPNTAVQGNSSQPANPQPAQGAYPYLDANGQPLNGQPTVTATSSYDNAQASGYVSDRYVRSLHRPVVVREQAPYQEQNRAAGYNQQPVNDYRQAPNDYRGARGQSDGTRAESPAPGAPPTAASGFVYDRLTHDREPLTHDQEPLTHDQH